MISRRSGFSCAGGSELSVTPGEGATDPADEDDSGEEGSAGSVDGDDSVGAGSTGPVVREDSVGEGLAGPVDGDVSLDEGSHAASSSTARIALIQRWMCSLILPG